MRYNYGFTDKNNNRWVLDGSILWKFGDSFNEHSSELTDTALEFLYTLIDKNQDLENHVEDILNKEDDCLS